MFSFRTYSFNTKNININNIHFNKDLCFTTSKIPNDNDSELVKFVKATSIFHCKANNIDVNDSDIEFEYWSKHFVKSHRKYNLHLDKDERLFENITTKMHSELINYASNNDVYPILTICSYFDDVVEPVVIVNAGSDTFSHKLQNNDNHNNIDLDSHNLPSQPAIGAIFPQKNTQVVFNGGTFLHGCIPFDDNITTKDRRIVIVNIWKRKLINFRDKPHKFFLGLPQKIFTIMPENMRQAVYNKNNTKMTKILETMPLPESVLWKNRLNKARIWDIDTGFDSRIEQCDFENFKSDYNSPKICDITKEHELYVNKYMAPSEIKLKLCKQYSDDYKLIRNFLSYNQLKERMSFQSLFNIKNFNRDNYYLLLFKLGINFHTKKPFKFKLLSVATDKTHNGFQNFMYTVNKNNIPHKILGIDTKWTGGDMKNGPGGGIKINLLKKELNTWSIDELKDTIILFTDSYDVILLTEQQIILDRYYYALNKYNYANTVLFSSEKSCWPDSTLQKYYPKRSNSQYLYLNSGSFIGNAMNIKKLICEQNISDDDDDQLFFTNIYLKNKLHIKCQIDYRCILFQTLNNSIQDITIKSRIIYNTATRSYPVILHGNGPSEIKNTLNYILSFCKSNNQDILYKNSTIFKPLYNISPLSIPTFIINMKRSIDRREHIIKKIKDSGLNNFKFVNAVDGKTDLCNYKFKLQHNNDINIGEIGCFLSHSNIWKYIIDNNIEYALVLEDDAVFHSCFNFYMNYIMQNIHLYESYDLIKINNFKNIDNDICLDDMMLKVDHIYNTSSYIISKNGAKKISELKPNDNIIPIDDYLSQITQRNSISAIATKFNLCNQELRSEYPSTIMGSKQYNNLES
jgi:GR25 family glycosyltransferase involved in LPS biosynthesis